MMRRLPMPLSRNRKKHHGTGSTRRVAPMSEIPLGSGRTAPEHQLLRETQLSLAIDSPGSGVGAMLTTRHAMPKETKKRAIALDEILWMRDVVQLTGKHRCTIHRWMHQGIFPPKNAPRGRPTGWLRSTIEQWLLGAAPTQGRE
jgi:predicted DNA-binding transcriptional regulator AlpA